MAVLPRRTPCLRCLLPEPPTANGGTCEGPPGPRGEGFYAGYFRDPDGNKLNAFVMG